MPPALSDLHLHRGAGPSIRCQLAARLAGLIRDGYLAPGTRLPSVRRLAEDLGLHRNTVWATYRNLERAKLVLAVQGTGVFVNDFQATGRLKVGPTLRLVLVEPFAQIRSVLGSELQARLGSPVRTVHPQFLDRPCAIGMSAGGVVFLVRRTVIPRLPTGSFAAMHVFPLEPSGGSRELAMVSRLPAHAVVAVITASASVRRFARTVAVTALREGIGFASPRPVDRAGVRRAMRIADMVFVDAASRWLIDPRSCKRLVELRMLSDRSIRDLRTALKCRAE